MFLHAGASLHGHEYSNRNRQVHLPNQRRSPLLRSPFAPPPLTRRSTDTDPPRTPALRPRRPLSEFVPRTPSPVVRFQEPEIPTAEPMSEDDALMSASECSDASVSTRITRKKKRRAPRSSTTFLLAHPAPKKGAKKKFIHIRPKLLLQLQQLVAGKRPRPSIDVYPSSLIAGSVCAPRFARRFPRIFGIKGELGMHDVILVKSEDYDAPGGDPESVDEEDSLEKRELIAVLSPIRREDRAEIVLNDGSIWLAVPLSSGSYDFIHTDPQGNVTTARWARRAALKAPMDATIPSPGSSGAPNSIRPDYRFTFSMINPKTRRHPIMATLTSTSLDVLEHYTTVSTSAGVHPPTRAFTRPSSPITPAATDSDSSEDESALSPPPPERTTRPVDEATKTLISVSAVWVALRHGWSPYFKPPAPSSSTTADGTPYTGASFSSGGITTPPSSNQTTPMIGSSRRVRSRSLTLDSLRQQRQSTPEVPGAPGPFSLRRGGTMPVQRDQSPAPSMQSTTGIPRRATSTGAAFMQRRRAQMDSTNDASDSEKATWKSKGRRVLSGDWGSQLATRGRRPSPPVSVGSFASVSENGTVVLSVEAVAEPAKPPVHMRSRTRQTQSAYYATSPLASMGVDLDGGEGLAIRHDDIAPQLKRSVEDDTRKETHKTKWRSVSNWFRRLGVH